MGKCAKSRAVISSNNLFYSIMEKLKIIIPTDFSVQADFAYVMVKKMEHKIPMQIHFVHVMSVPDTITLRPDGSFDTCGEVDVHFLEQQKTIADRKLAQLITTYGDGIYTHLLAGKITDAILDFSLAQHADLIVMGTKGAWGIKEKLSGTEAQAIATRSTIPVLSLMCDRSDLDINNILLVHDFTAQSNLDITLLHQLLLAFNSTLHLLQFVSEEDSNNKDAINTKMNEWAAVHQIPRFHIHLINDVNLEQAVIHFNERMPIDMVAIGIHEQHGIFKKQRAEALINHLYKPIISLRVH